MLQIKLSNKGTAGEGGGGGVKLQPGEETVNVACPDHLIIAELPVAKSLGSVSGVTLVKNVGRRSRRQLGERVHFCVRCDYPIAIYGRLTPCEHAFCLDCARSGSICYLCDERIQKIQTIKMMEGIFVCAAPHCLKSFLKKTDFESHIHSNHSDIFRNPNPQKDGNESEAPNLKKPATSDSTVQAPPRPLFSPSSNSHENAHQPPTRPLISPNLGQPFFGQIPSQPSDSDNSRPPGFDGLGPTNRFPQQGFETPSVAQQGILSETPFPNFAASMNTNMAMSMTPYPNFTEQGSSFLGFPPPGGMNFGEMYSRQWNVGPTFDPSVMMMDQGMVDGQGRVGFFQNQGVLPLSMPQAQPMQGGNVMDSRDGKGLLAPLPFPPPPSMPRDGQSFGWQQDKRDSFGNGQD